MTNHFKWNQKMEEKPSKCGYIKNNTSAGMILLVVFKVSVSALTDCNAIDICAFGSFFVAFRVFLFT